MYIDVFTRFKSVGLELLNFEVLLYIKITKKWLKMSFFSETYRYSYVHWLDFKMVRV